MRIFLVGEGPTDCGRPKFNKKVGQYVWEDGPAQIFIRKYVPDADIESMDKSKFEAESKTRTEKLNRRSLKQLKGHGIKAYWVARKASEEGYPVAALYVDADKAEGRAPKNPHECSERYLEMRDQVLNGLQKGGAPLGLAIIPMKMIECWLMGDANAFSKAFGTDVVPDLPRNPELIWGDKHNPNSDYPKNRLSRVLEQYDEECNMATYNQISLHSDAEAIARSCPISFGDFVQQMNCIMKSQNIS